MKNSTMLMVLGLLALLSCISSFLKGSPTSQPDQGDVQTAIQYHSQTINQAAKTAEQGLHEKDDIRFREAINICADLNRSDLLAEAFCVRSYSDMRPDVVELVKLLPIYAKKDFLIRTLKCDNEIFAWGKGSEEATIHEMSLTNYTNLIKSVANDTNMELQVSSVDEIRKRLIDSTFRSSLAKQIAKQ